MPLAPALLAFAVLCAAPAALAAGTRHPPIAAQEGCLTHQCHAGLLGPPDRTHERSLHPPAADGDCASCHDLALPGQARFVKGAPPGAGDGPANADGWDLELCTGCHGKELFAREAPPGATGFINGKQNLHALHVQAGRGRRCLTCHDPHGSPQPRLLRDRIPARGDVTITQQFRSESGGGGCRTGCHAPKGYRR